METMSTSSKNPNLVETKKNLHYHSTQMQGKIGRMLRQSETTERMTIIDNPTTIPNISQTFRPKMGVFLDNSALRLDPISQKVLRVDTYNMQHKDIINQFRQQQHIFIKHLEGKGTKKTQT